MLKEKYPLYLAGKPVWPNADLVVTDKFTQKAVTRTAYATPEIVNSAIKSLDESREAVKNIAGYKRQEILLHCVKRFTERTEELAETLCIEAGKPIKDACAEVARLVDTFRIASEECVRMTGEVLPLDRTQRAKGYTGFWKRVPIGPCTFITPFNFPLNLAAHKVASALAVGCPFILKPASLTPLGALIIGEILSETGLPPGAFSVLPCKTDIAEPLIVDDRIKYLSFTGSTQAGWAIKARAVKKKVTLEMGGNAACIVDEDAMQDDAVERITFGAFYQSGQSCISVQRILVHEKIYNTFREKLVTAAKKLKMGDPKDEDVFIGPVISEGDALRIEDWILSARKNGAKILCGGRRKNNFIEPTLLEGVPAGEKICVQEVFGPVAIIAPFKDFEEALKEANSTAYGLQAGVFTRDIYKAHRAWDALEVGGVIIGDVPSWRADHMPYGGVKESGQGREGIRFAMEAMTEIRLMVVRTP